ncbi:peptidase M22, glycoprotease [Magnetococcus marinus MC-1]|uniref:Peptidase M22, glycoprotease n=1 Tax=Magnetococcus marinus (strain ATCC BAA-1437 / JCM 17883 / MC-1) TaxID=156889 RepID=A0L5B5_MAGMM|nr:tRNA (adenosine(37)-N6)-threonylcarbamoyltransferase complex dimerization subunit type 1 TsaB [Magnetococcus marinus]ABK43158.1 peptidase M22, glycoprotease [Magnetococcus marinus MC-1]
MILALHTATPEGCVALVEQGELLAQERFVAKGGHLEIIPGMVQRLLASTGVQPQQVRRLVVTGGPGSFAGVRIAMGFAKGWHIAHGTALVCCSTTQAIAVSVAPSEQPLLVVMDARRGELFVQPFAGDGTPQQPPQKQTPEEAVALVQTDMRLCGSGVALLSPLLTERNIGEVLPGLVEPLALARLGARLAVNEDALLEPLYLRRSEAEENLLQRQAAQHDAH